MKKIGLPMLLALVMLISTACANPPAPTEAPVPTDIPIPTDTPIPTDIPVPQGVITGRVFLMDREEPVDTLVQLVLDSDNSIAASTRTDEDGYYSFSIEEPGDYSIQVSVYDLLNRFDRCENLRTLSGWPVTVRTYDTAGVTDILASTMPMSIIIGEEITVDCELYCD